MNIHAKLSKIQATLVANKTQFNNFGDYNYRSCEDIMQALKPHLWESGCTVTVSDEIVAVGHRIYVKATATFSDGENSISVSAFAREAENKKGRDDSQLTGATSSYARKYALAGLFAIDDNKDADYLNNNPSYTQQNVNTANSAITTEHNPSYTQQNVQGAYLPDDVFNRMLVALKSGTDKHGNPFTTQSIYDYLEKNKLSLTQEQRNQLGV